MRRNDSSGKAIITGRITDSLFDKQNTVIMLSVPDVILGRQTEYKKTVESDGSFTIEIPVVSPSYAAISVDSNEYAGLVLLFPGETTRMDLFSNETGKIGLCMIEGGELKPKDCNNIGNVSHQVMMTFIEGHNAPQFQPPITPEEYVDSMLIRMEKDLAVIYEDSLLSKNGKDLLYTQLKQVYLNLFFDYETYAHRFCSGQFIPQKPDKSYYAFLRHFDLNNPPQLYDIYYSKNIQSILTRPELNIPRLGNKPIVDWLQEVKAILSDLSGTDSGFFYDMLAAEAYILQFRDELNPLSEQQKENILDYFSNPSFADMLFAENERTLLQLKEIEANKQTNLVVNETPPATKEELMNVIVFKYKGKVVVVDFWNTWCAPCLEAMQTSRELKHEMLDKDVVFVYLANTSSPKPLWEKKIPGIGGEHYYLNGKEWESISFSDKYGFEGIPTYLIFDKNGNLRHKMTAYPGNKKMREMMEELLP
jgi:thiol-disulfide isomerase/thioredoxin